MANQIKTTKRKRKRQKKRERKGTTVNKYNICIYVCCMCVSISEAID